jgi:uncharacterized protein with von Willebrand factor type A (vWA) domain
MSNELEDMTLQIQHYESMLKIKDQQINSLFKANLRNPADSGTTKKNISDFKKLDTGIFIVISPIDKLATELFRSQKYASELDKINNQLQHRVRQQAELLSQLESRLQNSNSGSQISPKSSKTHTYSYMYQEIAEAWDMIEKVSSYLSHENGKLD